jgi:beta-N-acetylhexosaminidase
LHDHQLTDAGQLLGVGFDGPTVPPGLARRVATGRLGAVILFSRNVESPGQLATLCGDLMAMAPPDRPLLIAIDQEGGRVRRLREPWADWPAARVLGDTDDPALISRVGLAMGRELASCGVHLDLAPVLDVHTNPDNPVIGDRAFAAEPDAVTRRAAAFVAGLREAGVAACGKHFPGHGDTSADSHTDLPVVRHGAARLEAVELAPFAALAPDLPAMMTAHVIYEAWDAESPGTISAAVVQGLLRGRLGFEGLVLSDDMEMRAVADLAEPEDLAERCLLAGVDLISNCHDTARQERMLGALVRRAEADSAFAQQLRQSAARVAAFKRRHCAGRGRPDPKAAEALARDEAHHRLAAGLRA